MISTYKWTIITAPIGKWVFFYNETTGEIIYDPYEAEGGSYTCNDILVIADTLEECNEYIAQHGLVKPETNSNHDDL